MRALLAAAALCSIGAAEARAESKSIAVLPAVVAGERRPISSQRIFHAMEQAIEHRLALKAVRYEEIYADGAETALGRRIQDCGSSIACVGRALQSTKIELGLRIILNMQATPPLATLLLLDANAGNIGESTQELGASLALASWDDLTIGEEDAVLAELMTHAGALLDRAGYVRAGRILVTVSPPDAKVELEGDAFRETQPGPNCRFVVAPGNYRLIAREENHIVRTFDVAVAPEADTRVGIELEPEPRKQVFGTGGVIDLAAVAGSKMFTIVPSLEITYAVSTRVAVAALWGVSLSTIDSESRQRIGNAAIAARYYLLGPDTGFRFELMSGAPVGSATGSSRETDPASAADGFWNLWMWLPKVWSFVPGVRFDLQLAAQVAANVEVGSMFMFGSEVEVFAPRFGATAELTRDAVTFGLTARAVLVYPIADREVNICISPDQVFCPRERFAISSSFLQTSISPWVSVDLGHVRLYGRGVFHADDPLGFGTRGAQAVAAHAGLESRL